MNAENLTGSSSTFVRVAHDFYSTPPYCTCKLLEVENVGGKIWEPACGDGAIARLLPGNVYASDLHDRGFGEGGIDFTNQGARYAFIRRHGLDPLDWIITNPPYSHAEAFVRAAHDSPAKHFALLLKLNFLEGQKRAKLLFQETPPARIWVFAKRVSFEDGNAKVKRGAGLLAYAWFVWERTSHDSRIGWLLP